jgi:hypothetical protein
MSAMSDMSGPKGEGGNPKAGGACPSFGQTLTVFADIGASLPRVFQTNSASQNPTCIIAQVDVFEMPRQAK